MAIGDKRKQSLYFPADMLAEIQRHAERLDRSISWIVQYAYRHGREDLGKLPDHQSRPIPKSVPPKPAPPPPDEVTEQDLNSQL